MLQLWLKYIINKECISSLLEDPISWIQQSWATKFKRKSQHNSLKIYIISVVRFKKQNFKWNSKSQTHYPYYLPFKLFMHFGFTMYRYKRFITNNEQSQYNMV